MGLKSGDAELKQRIRSGQLTKEDVARRLAELAFGKANDCVKLALQDDAVLEQLALLADAQGEDMESFLKALQGDS